MKHSKEYNEAFLKGYKEGFQAAIEIAEQQVQDKLNKCPKD
jgi:flagellar biosynthesis/type III secretory pathway protein FliH